jgi:hypothetical protein
MARVTSHPLGADHPGATAFVDTTCEGDLAYHGGAEVRYGNDGWVR